MALTPDQEKMREAAKAATPGPWRECGHDRGGCPCAMIWATESDELVAVAWKGDDMVPAPAVAPNVNAAHIAAANPAAILALLDQVEALQADSDRWHWMCLHGQERMPEAIYEAIAAAMMKGEAVKKVALDAAIDGAMAITPLPPPPEAA